MSKPFIITDQGAPRTITSATAAQAPSPAEVVEHAQEEGITVEEAMTDLLERGGNADTAAPPVEHGPKPFRITAS